MYPFYSTAEVPFLAQYSADPPTGMAVFETHLVDNLVMQIFANKCLVLAMLKPIGGMSLSQSIS